MQNHEKLYFFQSYTHDSHRFVGVTKSHYHVEQYFKKFFFKSFSDIVPPFFLLENFLRLFSKNIFSHFLFFIVLNHFEAFLKKYVEKINKRSLTFVAEYIYTLVIHSQKGTYCCHLTPRTDLILLSNGIMP